MYFNLRVAEIKVAVEKQNRVLTAFITNVQQDIRSGGGVMPVPFGVGMNHLAAPEALIAAQKFGNDKIVVSDDEESDDDDSDSESDTDDEDDDECNEEEEVIEPVVSIINLQEMNFESPIPISFEVLSYMGDNEKASESSITEIIDVSAGLVDTSLVDTSVVDTSVVDTSLIDATAYEQMKVDELRKIATDKNLAPKEEVKKLKKPELLLLLKK
jgi:hypothetical protein